MLLADQKMNARETVEAMTYDMSGFDFERPVAYEKAVLKIIAIVPPHSNSSKLTNILWKYKIYRNNLFFLSIQ